MGWIGLLVLALSSAALLWKLGFPRGLWSFAGAAMMLGASGYALQGSPGLPGASRAAEIQRREVSRELVELRQAMLGRFTFADNYFVAADAMTRAGAPATAVRIMLGAVNKGPRDFAAWIGLGNAYVEHDGTMSPAARLAFARATQLAPNHPAPPFFTGLGYVRAGELAKARPYWARALALTPQDVSYRDEIAVRLMLLDGFLRLKDGAPQAVEP